MRLFYIFNILGFSYAVTFTVFCDFIKLIVMSKKKYSEVHLRYEVYIFQ